MRHVLVAPIVGDGSGDNPYRVEVPGARMVSAAIGSILTGPQRGQPLHDWSLVYADVVDEAAYRNAKGLVELLRADRLEAFDGALDSRVRQQLPLAVGQSARGAVDELLHRQYSYADRGLWEEKAAGFERIRGGAGGVVFVEDTFSDSDSTDLGSHSPDVGGAWSATDIWAAGHASVSNALEINSNTIRSTSLGQSSRVYRNAAEPSSAEYTITGTWRTGTTSNAAERSAFLARMTPTGTAIADIDYYRASFGYNSSAIGAFLAKVISNSSTTLASVNPISEGLQSATEYPVAFEVLNASKTLTVTGILELSSADNDITQVGRIGVGVGRRDGGQWIDTFVAETPPPTGAIAPSLRLSTTAGSAGDSEAGTPTGSLGKYMATNSPANGQLANLFPNITAQQNATGVTLYRCVFVQNDGPGTWFDASAYIESQVPGGGNISIGLDPTGVVAEDDASPQAVEIANGETAPAGVTFAVTSFGNRLAIGNILPGQAQAIWLRLNVPPQAAPLTADAATLVVAGDVDDS